MSRPSAGEDLGRPGWWQCVVRDATGAADRFVVVWSDRHPDGTRIDVAAEQATREIGDDAVCVATYGDSEQVVRLEVTPRAAPKAPPVWFAELRESTGRPPAVNLLAFTGHDCAPGTLLDRADLANLPVVSADQLGAVRWYPATGEVDQIYVSQPWRRRTVAGALVAAGTTLSLARGWPRFWGDGQRTELGEQLRNASAWRHRAAELTHVAPPMTPGEPVP
jgi:GNAT superfamily N-acetyltransferase